MKSIYAAIDDTLLIVRYVAGSWSVDRQLDGRSTQCLCADPQKREILYCGTFGEGLWRSIDAGHTWSRVGRGIAYKEITAVAVSPLERVGGEGIVYAGTEPSALFRSEDGGANWEECVALQDLPSKSTWSFPPRPWTHHVRCIGLDPHTSGLVIVCLENGAMVRSTNGGATFVDRTPDSPKDTHTLAFHRLVPDRVYSAAGDGFITGAGYGYFQSDDAGLSWYRPNDGIEWHYGWGLAVDSGDPDTMIISTAPSPDKAHNPAAAESTLYRLVQEGPWQEVRSGMPERNTMLASILAPDPDEAHVFYAVNNAGLFQSLDAGLSWQCIPTAWPDHYRWRHPNALLVT